MVCVAVLLIAGWVQVAHVCPMPARPGQQAITELGRESEVTSRALCLVCLGLHSPSLAAVVVSLFPGDGIVVSAVAVSQPAFSMGLRGFALHIRPPPSA